MCKAGDQPAQAEDLCLKEHKMPIFSLCQSNYLQYGHIEETVLWCPQK